MVFGISSHRFDIQATYAPLASSLPDHTSIYHKWPRENLRMNLPEYISIATMTGPSKNTANESPLTLMGKPIHILEGDRLEVALENYLPTTGLSLHFHGFEMRDAQVYDGVVGITQCAVSPNESFLYNFTVDEVPGTYWYHTHSGSLGVDSYNAIKGPIIVHPRNSSNYIEIMNKNNDMLDGGSRDFKSLLSYGNERILFFSDGSLMSDSHFNIYKIGGLNPPASKNEDGFTVGTMRYDFGTCNGKLREVVNVIPGETYKLRLLNGGSHYAFRIHIDGISMTIVAADSETVKPYEVDEVILHAAERFDVEITIPSDFTGGERFWIRADTLESTKQGYQNGIRAILNVVKTFSFPTDSDVPDPIESIIHPSKRVEDRKTMNCYSRHESGDDFSNQGSCLQITQLKPKQDLLDSHNHTLTTASDAHTVDFEFSPPPMHAHFVSIDGGLSLQHENPLKAIFDPSFDFSADSHPNTAMLNVPAHSSVIIVWRSNSLMNHPMHLHGYKMEMLAIDQPVRNRDCTLSQCKLSTAFNSEESIAAIDNIPRGSSVVKDTFILPAGGAVVTRIQTEAPALWFAHCHLDFHKDDGMAFILNVGNYQPPSNGTWLPQDYPSCDSHFLKTRREHPACHCYIDDDAVLGRALTKDHRCSRDHLCLHEQSQAANLDSYKSTGFRISSNYLIPNWGIALIVVSIIAGATVLITRCVPSRESLGPDKDIQEYSSSDSTLQKLRIRFANDWKGYRPGCTNVLRVFEVTGLALLTGYLFYDVGNDSTASGLSEKYSLLFFSITLWTFTRMYPAIANYNVWYKTLQSKCNNSVSDTAIWCISRCFVVVGNEAWWPMIHCFVCYPMAGMFHHVSSVVIMGIFLALNNMCYVSLGGTLGILFDSIPLGMSMSTIVSQTTLVAAGFYTHLPLGVSWIRYVSPVFWTYRGIVKTALRWTDTYACVKGQSDIGSNQCYLEFSPGIDALKKRGINLATFNDSKSDEVYLEATMLCLLLLGLQIIMFGISWRRRVGGKNVDDTEEETESPEPQVVVLTKDDTLEVGSKRQLRRRSSLVTSIQRSNSFFNPSHDTLEVGSKRQLRRRSSLVTSRQRSNSYVYPSPAVPDDGHIE